MVITNNIIKCKYPGIIVMSIYNKIISALPINNAVNKPYLETLQYLFVGNELG